MRILSLHLFSLTASTELHQEALHHSFGIGCGAYQVRADPIPDRHHIRRGRGVAGPRRAIRHVHAPRGRNPVCQLPLATARVPRHR